MKTNFILKSKLSNMKRIFGTVFLFICFVAFAQGQNLQLKNSASSTNVTWTVLEDGTHKCTLTDPALDATLYDSDIQNRMNGNGYTAGNVRIEVPGNVTTVSSGIINVKKTTAIESNTLTIVAIGTITTSIEISLYTETSNAGNGYNGHNLVLEANGDITIGGNGIYAYGQGALSTRAAAAGGGDVNVTSNAGSITLSGTSARISTYGYASSLSTINGGNGGNITIQAQGVFSVSSNTNGFQSYGGKATNNANGGNGGNISISVGSISITSNYYFYANGGAGDGTGKNGGDGGIINFTTSIGNINMSGNSEVRTSMDNNKSTNNARGANAGAITFQAAGSIIRGNGSIFRAYGSGGNGTGSNGNAANVTLIGNGGITSDVNTKFLMYVETGGLTGTGTAGDLIISSGNNTVTAGNTGANSGLMNINSDGIQVRNIIKKGDGTIAIFGTSGASNIKGTTTIEGGTLLLKAISAVNQSQDLILDGGTLSVDGTLAPTWTGHLKMTANGGTIKFIAGNTAVTQLKFPAYAAGDWNANAKLTIEGWTDTKGTTGKTGKFFMGTTTAGLLADQLAQVVFSNLNNSGNDYSAMMLVANTGEVVPNEKLPTLTQPQISLGIDDVAGILENASAVDGRTILSASNLALGGGVTVNDFHTYNNTVGNVVVSLKYKISGVTSVDTTSILMANTSHSTSPDNGVWAVATPVDILGSLPPGDYTVSVWYSAVVGNSPVLKLLDNNAGENYVFTVTKPVPIVHATEICAIRGSGNIQISLLPANTTDYITTINATDYSGEKLTIKNISQTPLPMTVEIHTSNGLKLIKKFW
ncbi:MAG: hypothetical protein LBN27_12725 [Prevotellaceae bacterium]|jgi:hypothetical protein|nr:hypothetical protein [Prevotellaceae bacterium]